MNNFYDDHPLLAERGVFWRCDHGHTGFRAGFVWRGCARCWLWHQIHFIGRCARRWYQVYLIGRWVRQVIVRAAPTCTLWRYRVNTDEMVFRPWSRWIIPCIEYNQLAWGERGPCMWARKREMCA